MIGSEKGGHSLVENREMHPVGARPRGEPRFGEERTKPQRPEMGLSTVTVPSVEEFVHYGSTTPTRRFSHDLPS